MSEFVVDHLDFQPDGPPPSATPSPPHPRPTAQAHVAGDRGISPVAGRSGPGRGGKALAFLGMVAGSGAFLVATWTHPYGHKPTTVSQEPVRQVVDFDSVRATPTPVRAPPNGVALPPGLTDTKLTATAAPSLGSSSLSGDGQVVPALSVDPSLAGSSSARPAAPAATGATGPAVAAAKQEAALRAAKLQAIRSAPILAFSTQVHAAGGRSGDGDTTGTRTTEGGGSELDQLRRGSSLGLVRAQRLPDRNFLVTAGALLPCVLETAIETSAPGFVTCRITRDVYSDNGGVVLMEKGSRALGEYRSGFQQGRARIFVLWDRVTTPGGVAVDVSSPASDALGRAGFDGRIDSHFWQRFGGALLLTSVGGGISAAATADARLANVTQAPNEAAAAALQNSINIPPTLTKQQGAEVAIFVSHDLDFSSVYALKGR